MSEQKDNKKKFSLSKPLIIQSVFFAVLILALAILVFKSSAAVQKVSNPTESSTASLEEIKPPEELEPVATPEPTPEPTPEGPLFKPYATETTDPARLLKLTGISVDGVEVAVGEYAEPEPIDFPLPEEYSSLKGITTFRGNNFRDGGNYGTAEINEKKLNLAWTLNTTSLVSPDGNVWSGIGWTGQPLIVEWPKETRALMNMEGWAKEKDVLIEVISPTMGGKIQFCELESGKKTRADIDVGFPFKGTGTLDPRGYPLLYIGSGYHSSKGTSRVFIISLVDGSILHSFGTDDPFAIRPWPMFDSAPLVDGKTDRLIYPGENGLIYIIKLNAAFDKE
ncbi:MAG: pyrrolo-quinoline quinone, partial [Clostridiales bacterium]|nr:pyrrolo-quinoline quinone [Clostridiales bacterium]